jgi:very-short-patch-repair endonuclease
VVRKRSELFPDEPRHKHAHWDYYVVGCADLRHLPHIIPSRKPRRLLFISTTIQKLLTAPEINYLFNDSPLEDMLWLQLLEGGIPSERQYEVSVGQGRYKLDFAVFCKDRNLAIECDGDAHHMRRSAVERDKRRSNSHHRAGVGRCLHFTTNALTTRTCRVRCR